jgi:hypothetical protein
LKVSCHSWGLGSDVLKGILWDSAAINSVGSEAPTGRGSKMLLGPQWESRSQRLEPIKNKRGWKERFKMGFPNVLEKNKIYLESLVLIRHLRVEAWRGWWARVWI